LNIKPGDSVKVKEGIMCPDQEDLCLGGWQGRVFEIEKDEDGSILIGIKWDSITLKNMPASFIDQSEEEGTDYATMYLAPEEVEPAAARDTEEDVEEALAEISKKYSWSWLGEEGRRINEVLAGVEEKDGGEAFDAWENHFRCFPFRGGGRGVPEKRAAASGRPGERKETFHGGRTVRHHCRSLARA